MKPYHLIFFLFLLANCTTKQKKLPPSKQSTITIMDLTSTQLALMKQWQDQAGPLRDTTFLQRLYEPHLALWNNYLGDSEDFLKWLNEISFPELSFYKEQKERLDLSSLNDFFHQTVTSMRDFTGFDPYGKWFILFGPKWTDAGGIGQGKMVLDLANSANTLAHVKLLFPHELNHQIYDRTLPGYKSIVLKRILDEGFACYVNYLFHQKEITIAQSLNYSEKELLKCRTNDEQVIAFLKKHHTSENPDIANLFADRSYQIAADFPGAIGYYLGFRIVEEYVQKYGENSWKNIYSMTPEDVLAASGILAEQAE